MNRSLIRHGFVLILVALISGMFVPMMMMTVAIASFLAVGLSLWGLRSRASHAS